MSIILPKPYSWCKNCSSDPTSCVLCCSASTFYGFCLSTVFLIAFLCTWSLLVVPHTREYKMSKESVVETTCFSSTTLTISETFSSQLDCLCQECVSTTDPLCSILETNKSSGACCYDQNQQIYNEYNCPCNTTCATCVKHLGYMVNVPVKCPCPGEYCDQDNCFIQVEGTEEYKCNCTCPLYLGNLQSCNVKITSNKTVDANISILVSERMLNYSKQVICEDGNEPIECVQANFPLPIVDDQNGWSCWYQLSDQNTLLQQQPPTVAFDTINYNASIILAAIFGFFFLAGIVCCCICLQCLEFRNHPERFVVQNSPPVELARVMIPNNPPIELARMHIIDPAMIAKNEAIF